MSNNSSKNLKREKANTSDPSTAEYDDWAKKFVNRPIPQIGVPPINGLGLVGSQVHLIGDGVPANEGFDIDSAIGRFSWETITTGKFIPAIYRRGEKFCSIRMLESSILGDLLQVVPQEIYDSAKLTSYYITNAESKLLTYINTWHCDGRYGARNFSVQDLIVSLEETIKLYEYITFAYEVLSSGGKNKDDDFSKCGFVRVNNDSLIPYTVLKDGEKSVPLFYFEGQTEILKEKAEPLSGWELSYLKVCCKVQGVRKDLISGDTLQIVKLTDLRSYFPKRSTFEENCWPPPKSKSLLPKPSTISSISNTSVGGLYNNSLSITGQNHKIPNRIVSNENFRTTTMNVVKTIGNPPIINPTTTTVVSRTIMPSNNSTSSNINFNLTSQQNVTLLNTSSNGLVRTNGSNNLLITTTTSTTTTAGNIVTTNYNNNNIGLSVTAPNGITLQLSKPLQGKKGGSELLKLRVPNAPADFSRLSTIQEQADGTKEGAYGIRTITLEKDIVLHCINSKPFKTEYLIILLEFINKYFPGVSIYPTAVSVLKSIGITTYLPNSTQINAFNKYGFSINRNWEIPLVSVTEAVGLMPRIKLLLTPKPPLSRLPDNNSSSSVTTRSHSSNNNNSLYHTNAIR